MPGSTAIAPLTPRLAPASAARAVSGRTPTTTRTMSAARVTAVPSAAVACDFQPPGLAGRGPGDGLDGGAGQHLHAVAGQFGVHQRAELGVDGGQDLGQLFHLGDGQPADGQGVGHLQADVPGADDDRAGRGGLLQGRHDGERVAHRVQQVHPVARAQGLRARQAADRGPDRDRAGADDELVVAEQFLAAVGRADQELAAGHVDATGGSVQPQPHPGGFQVGQLAVGQVAPVGDLAGDVVGDAADGEVRVGVGQDHGDLRGRVDLAGPQGGTDPGVAAADRDQVHGRAPSGELINGAGRGRSPRAVVRARARRRRHRRRTPLG